MWRLATTQTTTNNRTKEAIVENLDHQVSSSGFSIIVCAYNAEERIENTLRHLSRLKIPTNSEAEVILVDNASTDRTTSAAEAVWIEVGQPFPLIILEERRQGQALARRTGVLAARFQYGVFCDDDNWLDTDYLIAADTILASDPAVGVVGGCSTPEADVGLPPWFYTSSGAFAVGIQGVTDGDVTHQKYVWGAGMAFRTRPLKRIYLSDLNPLTTGRSGTLLTSGDDGELCAWFIFYGYKLHYSSTMRFKHYMASRRLTDEYFSEFVVQHPPSIWSRYSDYLTVRYILWDSGNNTNAKLRLLAVYVFSVGRLLLHRRDAWLIRRVDRRVRRIAKNERMGF